MAHKKKSHMKEMHHHHEHEHDGHGKHPAKHHDHKTAVKAKVAKHSPRGK